MRVEIVTFKERQIPVQEILTSFWRAKWEKEGEKVGLKVVVPTFADTRENLEIHLGIGDKPIYVPLELDLPTIGKIFRLSNYNVSNGYLPSDVVDHSGWRYVQVSSGPSYLGLSEDEVREVFLREGREGFTLIEEIIASYYIKELTGHFLDEGNLVRLLGTIKEGFAMNVRFYPDGEFASGFGPEHSKNRSIRSRSSVVCQLDK